MSFVTYENRSNPHITIHRSGCHHLRKHGGHHKYNQGKYENHTTYAEAERYAKLTQLPIKNCQTCSPGEAK